MTAQYPPTQSKNSTRVPAHRAGTAAIIGLPNSGKSSLFNALLGSSLSIVTPKPQTTRDQIRGVLDRKEGQIVFIDTPGFLRESAESSGKRDGLASYMIHQTEQALEGLDVLVYLVDPGSTLERETLVVDRLVSGILDKNTQIILAVTKADRVHDAETKSKVGILKSKIKSRLVSETASEGKRAVHETTVSIRNLRQLGSFSKLLFSLIPEGPALFPKDTLTDRPTRFFASEYIREQLFLATHQEIPYSCAVVIDEFRESTSVTHIRARIILERESQKPIVIGKQGLVLKQVGTRARKRIEKLIGGKVFLDLHATVRPDWSRTNGGLQFAGYKEHA